MKYRVQGSCGVVRADLQKAVFGEFPCKNTHSMHTPTCWICSNLQVKIKDVQCFGMVLEHLDGGDLSRSAERASELSDPGVQPAMIPSGPLASVSFVLPSAAVICSQNSEHADPEVVWRPVVTIVVTDGV